MMESKKYTSDFLIIGSGIAGLSLAIKASEKGTVNIVTKNKGFVSSTNRAQGGIASVLAPSDSFENHIADTLRAGAGLNNKKAVELLVHEGPDAIEELINWGAHFTYSESGKELDLGREGGHSHNRIVHARDLTGLIFLIIILE
jgi:L-aspartate oxidase